MGPDLTASKLNQTPPHAIGIIKQNNKADKYLWYPDFTFGLVEHISSEDANHVWPYTTPGLNIDFLEILVSPAVKKFDLVIVVNKFQIYFQQYIKNIKML